LLNYRVENGGRLARASFLENDSQEGAAEIRKEGGRPPIRSGPDGRERKRNPSGIDPGEGEKLAEDGKQGTVDSVKKLDEAFAQIYQALAPQHSCKAGKS
jgi:hypothetical protein